MPEESAAVVAASAEAASAEAQSSVDGDQAGESAQTIDWRARIKEDPELAKAVQEEANRLFQKTRPPEKTEHHLTPQEVRILGLLAEGHSYQTAASRLHITVNTLRNYIRSIYDKLHGHSKTEAVRKALRSGIIV